MLKNEWSALYKNKIFLLVIVAIIAIPTIYTTLFLGSMWDPYGNTDQLPVALVNEDKPVTYEDKQLNVGEDLVHHLKENNSLAFHFVNNINATQCLKNGTYYMVITIPADFSKNASTLMNAQPKKMELDYTTNPGTNYIASKMSETALLKIKESVADEVTKTYAQSVFDQIKEIGCGMQEASDGASQLQDGAAHLANGNHTIAENLKFLADSTLTFKNGSDGAASLASGTDTLVLGTKDLKSGASRLDAGLTQINSNVPTLATGVDALSDGTSSLASGTATLKKGSANLSAGTQSLSEGLTALQNQSGTLTDGAHNLENGLTQIITDLKQTGNVASPSANTPSINIPVSLLSEQVEHLRQCADSAGNASEYTALPPASDTSNLTSALTDALATGDMEQVENVAKQAIAAASANETIIQNATTQLATMSDALSSSSNNLEEIATNANRSSDSQDSNRDNTALITQLTTILDESSTLSAGLDNYTSGVSASSKSSSALAAGASYLDIGITETDNGAQKLKAGNATLQSQIPTLQAGIGQSSTGATQLNAGTGTLLSGAEHLNTGATTLSAGTNQLLTGAEQLNSGMNTLSMGTGKLVVNNSTLLNGTSQLSDGAEAIRDGSTKLYDGSIALGDGIHELSDGSSTLTHKLSDGATTVNNTNASDDAIAMFASPITDHESQITTVENNGHAMAPYMMSVALWVGCIAFCIMYPLMKYTGTLKSGVKWWASKASVLYVIAILQALIMILMLHLFNGFNPAEMGKTLLVAVLASVTFMSILYFFNVCLGKIGSFLMLVFMVVQLAGSAGTYPVELSGSFVAAIHKWLPFSYTVNAFRSTISGGESITATIIVLSLLFAVFTVLTLLVFQIRTFKIKRGKRVMNELLEEKGFM